MKVKLIDDGKNNPKVVNADTGELIEGVTEAKYIAECTRQSLVLTIVRPSVDITYDDPEIIEKEVGK